jgi:hypothetical protein
MKALAAIILAFLASTTILAADPNPNPDDSIQVTVTGTLRTGVVAIGGETTGTTVTAQGITWELDLGKSGEFVESAKKFNGKKVVVQGNLDRRPGVEVKERWIVTVTELR